MVSQPVQRQIGPAARSPRQMLRQAQQHRGHQITGHRPLGVKEVMKEGEHVVHCPRQQFPRVS